MVRVHIACHKYLYIYNILILVSYLIQCLFILIEKFKCLIVNNTYTPANITGIVILWALRFLFDNMPKSIVKKNFFIDIYILSKDNHSLFIVISYVYYKPYILCKWISLQYYIHSDSHNVIQSRFFYHN